MLVVPSNIAPPAAITIRFEAPALAYDLSNVISVALDVLRKNGTRATWDATIVSVTPYELVAQYVFQAGDVAGTGVYYLAPRLAVQGGFLPAASVAMFVADPFGVTPKLETDAWLIATTVVPTLGTPSSRWVNLTAASSPHAANPLAAWVSLRLDGPITVDLWTAADGDVIVIVDALAASGTYALTLVGDAGSDQQVPNPLQPGMYVPSAVYDDPALFPLRLKYSDLQGVWLRW